MAAALPVALWRNQAVEGAFVVVGGRERVADFPQRQRRTKDLPSEAEQLGVRSARPARKIRERNFHDAESAGVGLDQDFFLHLEIRGCQFQLGEHLAPVQTVSAGYIEHWYR